MRIRRNIGQLIAKTRLSLREVLRNCATWPNESGWLWCETLGVWLGTWEGSVEREPPTGNCHWLRFYDRSGNLVLLPEELAELQAQQAHERAERLAKRLRELGEDPDGV